MFLCVRRKQKNETREITLDFGQFETKGRPIFQHLPREILDSIVQNVYDPPKSDRILLEEAREAKTSRALQKGLSNLAKLAFLSMRLYAVTLPILYRYVVWPDILDSMEGSGRGEYTRSVPKDFAGRPRRKPEARFKSIRVLKITSFDRPMALFDLLGKCDKLRSVYIEWDEGLGAVPSNILVRLQSNRLMGLWLNGSPPKALEFAIRMGQLNWLVVEACSGHPQKKGAILVNAPLRVTSLEVYCLSRQGVGSIRFLLDNTSRASIKALGLYDLPDKEGIINQMFDHARPFKGVKLCFTMEGPSTPLADMEGLFPQCDLRIAGDDETNIYGFLPSGLRSLVPDKYDLFRNEGTPLLAVLREGKSLTGLRTVVLPARPPLWSIGWTDQRPGLAQACEQRGINVSYRPLEEIERPFGAMYEVT